MDAADDASVSIPLAVRSAPALAAADAVPPGAEPARSLYIHVPFCSHKCHYCDFYSFVDTRDQLDAFVAALEIELAFLAPLADPAGLNTIFIGGGTPSLLRTDLWRGLLATLDRLFNLGPIRSGRGEFTVECNPDTVTRELMDTLAAGGVDRISLGAQSFDPAMLRALERTHSPENVGKALAHAAAAGIDRRSIDLIYAIPAQTLAGVRADLEAALSLDPGVEHLSAYCLTYEPNTPLTARAERGDITPTDEDTAAAMQTLVHETLAGAGFERYEVSNYARILPNSGTGVPPVRVIIDGGTGVSPVRAASLHNLAYWKNESWLAAGPSASAHILTSDPDTGLPAGARWKNVPRLGDWIAGVTATGSSPITDHEPPDPARTLREHIMMGIRISEGVDAGLVLAHADRLGVAADLARAADSQRTLGLLETTGDRWRLTDPGYLHADGVAARLMAAIPGD